MIGNDLAATLTAMVESVSPPPAGPIYVTDVDLTVPLEVSTGTTPDGELLFFARPPHSRWKAGVLPRVHMSRLRVVALEPEGTALAEAEDAG